jgi:hypothetical protein
VTDVSQASVLLFETDTKEHLLGPLNTVLDSVSRTALAETILAMDEGKGDIESESSAKDSWLVWRLGVSGLLE